MASPEGGMDIEEVAHNTPDRIYKLALDPFIGVMPAQCRSLSFQLGFNLEQIKQFTKMLSALVALFYEQDVSLLEVNPLVIDGEGNLVCLDGKINLDDNALFRHPDIAKLCDYNQEDDRVNHAHKWELNYIPLDGSIGCMVNGAGLAMATMDIIKLYGAEPANFLDVGGSATKERVAEALKIILSDSNVKGILVNIFGGIVRCDLIADGIIAAVKEVAINVPLVVRLEGNNAAAGIEKLNNTTMRILSASSLQEAAKIIVEQTKD
jgi:succinyl-CoA synthetase beta subunit